MISPNEGLSTSEDFPSFVMDNCLKFAIKLAVLEASSLPAKDVL